MAEEYLLERSVPHRPSSSRPVILVQARMGSTRLPGKVMLPLAGVPMVQRLLERLSSLKSNVPVILAIPDKPADFVLVPVAQRLGVRVFSGSEEDVLDRFASAVAHDQVDAIVRLTADCPLIDPAMVDRALDLFYHLQVDYLSNTLHRTYPRGFDIEIVSRAAFMSAAREAKELRDREHVTPFILEHPERFTCACFIAKDDLSSWRLTVDTKDDVALVERVLSELTGPFSYEMVREVLLRHPEWQCMNAHVKQKQD
jgi:spore coat polysaccharide biosynthesis protein SpsF